ncbi:hypothetical protein [Deinococcus roseus]|uniref:Uncharacterized protein n=1 Tax=Deinococcus roseus TaxID=392414 RepID=A0ABQ2CXH8_9DEIO|nr:hypothetical protein [Deinococcus roseus]GGJ30811.1 hypothetical protein GCM10008938_16070 [Deinococcus roseus]
MTGPVNKSPVSQPLIWVIVGLLAVAGGGAYYVLNQQPAPDPEVITPLPPVDPNTGPVQTGKPLVVKDLPFLTTVNREVDVVLGPDTEAGVGPSNRTSNPFIPVTIPPSTLVPDTTTAVNPTQTIPDFNTTPIPVNTSPTITIPNTNTLPSGNTNTGGITTTPPIVLPSTGQPVKITPPSTNGTTGTTGTNRGSNTIKALPLPAPSVVQPGTSSTGFAVPEQNTTVISAPTPVLISSLVIPAPPQKDTPQPDEPVTPPKESELLKTANELQLAFSSVVIGPNSTAIFNSKNGYLMAAAGQKLAGTDILVKSISQQQVTLQLGEETLELTLDRR